MAGHGTGVGGGEARARARSGVRSGREKSNASDRRRDIGAVRGCGPPATAEPVSASATARDDAHAPRPRQWLDPVSGMVVDTETGALSVTRDDAVVSVYREWMRLKGSKTIGEFLRSYLHCVDVWHDRPAVNGLPAVPVGEQKREWLQRIDDLEAAAKECPDVTKSHYGLLILRRLVIIHRSDDADVVAALSDGNSALVDTWQLRMYTYYMKGLPTRCGTNEGVSRTGATAATITRRGVSMAGTCVARSAEQPSVPPVHLQQQQPTNS